MPLMNLLFKSMNPLVVMVVVDVRFISVFLHAQQAVNSHTRQLLNFYQLIFPEFDVNVLKAILTIKRFSI